MGGMLGREYHGDLIGKTTRRHRLDKRIITVGDAIVSHVKNPPSARCLDVGSASGLFLARLNSRFNFREAVGIELNEELARENRDSSVRIEVGDAEALPFPENRFDLVIAVGTIEHLDYPKMMLTECHRVLREGGIMIVTARNPFYERIGKRIGLVNREVYLHAYTHGQMSSLIEGVGFEIFEETAFMVSPFFPVPFESRIESVLKSFRKSRMMMLKHLFVGKKT